MGLRRASHPSGGSTLWATNPRQFCGFPLYASPTRIFTGSRHDCSWRISLSYFFGFAVNSMRYFSCPCCTHVSTT